MSFNLKTLLPILAIVLFFANNASAQTTAAPLECKPATVNLVFRDHKSDYIPGISFEINEQGVDADGQQVGLKKIGTGKTSALTGIGSVKFTPDILSPKVYAVKAYDKNANVGEFWFYNSFSIGCEQTLDMTYYLSSVRFVFREGNGELKKNMAFSLYTQKYDIEDNPIYEKKDLVSSSLNTGSTGEAIVYVADEAHTVKGKGGNYVLSANLGGDVGYIENYIHVSEAQQTEYEYIMSDLRIIAENAAGELLSSKKSINLYEQLKDVKGNLVLGKKLKTVPFNSLGEVTISYPAGIYALTTKDDFNRDFIFWNINIEKGKRNEQPIVTSFIRVDAIENKKQISKGNVNVYDLTKDYKGNYFRNKKIATLPITIKGYAEASLIPGNYLFTTTSQNPAIKGEFGQIVVIQPKRLQKVTLNVATSSLVALNNGMIISNIISSSPLAEKFKGYILLQVESKGEAWYVDLKNKNKYYLKDGDTAYQLMRKMGTGITNQDLSKIPIGIDSRMAEFDTDADGLPNKLEEAIGTDPNNGDTDYDGYVDSDEIKAGYNPNGPGKLENDLKFAAKSKGKIYLQVESKGEAWYVNPKDGKRYYLADGQSAYNLMRFLGLGITNMNLEEINEAIL